MVAFALDSSQAAKAVIATAVQTIMPLGTIRRNNVVFFHWKQPKIVVVVEYFHTMFSKGCEYFLHHCFTADMPEQFKPWSGFRFNLLHLGQMRTITTGEPQERHTSEDVTLELNSCLLIPHSQQNSL